MALKTKDLLEAILTCEQDHVRFVETELAGVAQQQRSRIEILRAYIQENLYGFVDLKKDRLPANHDHASCPGYINVHDGRAEYLLSEERLQEIMGGQKGANQLKRELHDKGFISTVSAGEGGSRYSTKRTIGKRAPHVGPISGEICEN